MYCYGRISTNTSNLKKAYLNLTYNTTVITEKDCLSFLNFNSECFIITILPEAFFCVSDPSNVGGGDDSDEPGGDERVKAVVADHVRVAGLVVGVKLKQVAYCSSFVFN